MVDTLQYAENLKEISTLSKEFADGINRATNNSFGWGLEQMADSYVSIFDRFCPFQIDDRVEMLRDVEVKEGSGWYHCRHFLIRGGKATINSRGYSDGKFSFDVVLDDETWIDNDGNKKPVQTKHTFGLNETYFRKCDE